MDVSRSLPGKKNGRISILPKSESFREMGELNVVFSREEQKGGYGLTVMGDNPVFVQSVTKDGPAAAVGLQPGDRIIRVNGFFVTAMNHISVVDLIKAQPHVAMTVVRSRGPGINGSQQHVVNPSYDRHEEEPPAKERDVEALWNILNTEVTAVEELRKKTIDASGLSERAQTDLDNRLKYIRALESQLREMGVVVPVRNLASVEETTKNGSKLSQPPTPPPIESIPRHQDDFNFRGQPRNAASSSGLNRRRSNPEAMHLGVNRMTLSSGALPDQTALNRSSSALSVAKLERKSSIPDEVPPALPAKRRSDPRVRNASLHDFSDPDLAATPSGTPPPPYGGPDGRGGAKVPKSGSFNGLACGTPRVASFRQVDVITAEESIFVVNQGPFQEYFALQRSLPHLAVFLNFLFTHSALDAVPVLFHLITDVYPKGNAKELARWAFEIHSTFIVPGSPLDLLSCVPCEQSHSTIVSAIDDALSHPEREEQLRMVFGMARSFALEAIKHRLGEFQERRAQGLSTLYGPNDIELEEAASSTDRGREVVDKLLSPHLEALTYSSPEEPDNRSDSHAALGCALATFLKLNGVKAIGRDGVYLVDKWPLFVQKDKSKFRLKDKSKKCVKSGHQFAPVSVNGVCCCLHCHTVLWGVGPQGYQCQACDYTAHRGCVRNVEELCVGEKKERRSFISMDSFGIFGRKRSNNSPTAISNAKKGHDEKEDNEVAAGAEAAAAAESRDEPRGYVNQVVNRIETGKMQQDSTHSDPVPPPLADKTPRVPLTVVGRSESLKAQKKAQIKPGVRKKSDPAHFQGGSREDEVDEAGGPDQNGHQLAISGSSSVSLQSLPSDASALFEDDPDLEADPEHIPSWQTMLTDPAVVDTLDNRAKHRQEVLAELFHTEQTHVGKLKMLYKVFYIPMSREQLLSAEVLHQVFANLEEMLKLHVELNEQFKEVKARGKLIGPVGDLLLSRFTGERGTAFKMAAAAFNRNQTTGLEALKVSQVKHPKLVKFLEEAAANPLCRRLMLKDIIPTGMQRLTKYPLLLENLVKYTPSEADEDQIELKKIQAALAASKEILDFVNHAIHESANVHRLRELQAKIDMTSFVKSQHKMALEHKNIDLSKYCLLFDGDLTWRLTKQKTVDLHVILLNKILLLVTKQDEKLLLKFHASPVTVTDSRRTGETFSKPWAPVLSLDGLSVRDVATDPRAFFLFQVSSSGFSGAPQMYEMVANTDKEQKQWKKYILEAINRVSHEYESIKETFPSSATASVTAPLPIVSGEQDAPDSGTVHSDEDDFTDDVMDDVRHIERLTLTSPSDVVVTEPFVLEDAKVVISPMEQLRRRDSQVEECLADKHRLVSQILGISPSTPPISTSDPLTSPTDESPLETGKTVMHHLMTHANSLTRLLNDSLTISLEEPAEKDLQIRRLSLAPLEDAPTPQQSVSSQTMPTMQPGVALEDLQPIVVNLTRDLSSLLAYFTQQDAERERLRLQLTAARAELISVRTETRSPTPTTLRPDSGTSFHSSSHSEEAVIPITSSLDTAPDEQEATEPHQQDNLPASIEQL